MGGIAADYTGHTLLVAPPRLAAVERWFLRAGVFILPLAYWWDTYDRYVLPKLLVARVLLIGLVIFFLARVIVTGSLTIRRTPLDLPLLAFVLSAFLSTGFAYSPNVAVFGTYARYDGLLTILTYAGLFWLTVQNLAGPGDTRALFRVLLASGYLVAAIAILQSVTDSIGQGGIVPAFGTLGQQNVLGAFLALLCPLAFRELLQSDTWSKRVVALNLLAVLGAGLILTLSRSAWLGTAVAVLVLIVGSPRPTLRPRALAALILLGGLIAVGLSLAGRLPLEQQIQARALTIFDVSAWGPRPAIWRDSVQLIESRPIFGYGPDNVGLVYPRFQATNLGRSQVDKAHAESLQVAATQGLVGLAAYTLVLAAFVRAFWKGRRREGAVAIFAAWVAYQVTLQLNFSALAASLPFWIFAAAAMESWGATRSPAAQIALPRSRVGVGAGTVAIAALAALAMVATVFPYLADSQLRRAVTADIGGRSDLAQGAAARARDLAPRESVYAVEVGNIAFERTDWASAAQAYDDAAQLGTYNPLVYRNLALADLNLGRFTEARAAAAKAVELDRFDPANRALLAQFGAGP
jgi:O-antigen ligase